MKSRIIILSLIIVITYTIIYSEEPNGTEWKEYKMTYSTDWNTLKNIVTIYPQTGEITDKNNYITLPNPKDPMGFVCMVDRKNLKLDVDGNGSHEKDIKQKEDFIDYKLTYDKISIFYRIRVWMISTSVDDKTKYSWHYQRGGFMRGKVAGETVILIDDNNNGKYNDYGKDALLIGSSNKSAGLLSSLVSIKDKFYELDVGEAGNLIKFKEYSGPIGLVDVKSGLNWEKPKLDHLIIRQQASEIYLDIPVQPKTVSIPVGEYNLIFASFGKRICARGGAEFTVTESQTEPTVLIWGGPFNLTSNVRCERGGQLVELIMGGTPTAVATAEPVEPTPATPPQPETKPAPPKKEVPGYIAVTARSKEEAQQKIDEWAKAVKEQEKEKERQKSNPPPAPPPKSSPSPTATSSLPTLEKPISIKGPLQASGRTVRKLEYPFIVMSRLPEIYGQNGEEYYCDHAFLDERGSGFPDETVFVFNIEIYPKNMPVQLLNKVGNPLIEKWWQTKVGILPASWEPYRCPITDYRGLVTVKVSLQSQIFGNLSYVHDVEVSF